MVSVFVPVLTSLISRFQATTASSRIQPGCISCRFVARRPCVASLPCLCLLVPFLILVYTPPFAHMGNILAFAPPNANHHTPIQHAVFFRYTEQRATADAWVVRASRDLLRTTTTTTGLDCWR
ncbi:hypothetical protein BDA96_01G448500 [Sorghum bicolor]|uniref:Uncharacterized protein n=2 Tax=Sorghum bicolor TaxID=4558 RepID=A0A921S5P1_SORBI|nr:hypothetical protein BDA96_01G448500 [Sorghum bicolor]OQU92825.1 hypothetical protein SORBI_3001G421450 [Sorghum bicolor]